MPTYAYWRIMRGHLWPRYDVMYELVHVILYLRCRLNPLSRNAGQFADVAKLYIKCLHVMLFPQGLAVTSL